MSQQCTSVFRSCFMTFQALRVSVIYMLFSFVKLSLSFLMCKMGIVLFFSQGFVSEILVFKKNFIWEVVLVFASDIQDLVLQSYSTSSKVNIGSVSWFLFEIQPMILSCLWEFDRNNPGHQQSPWWLIASWLACNSDWWVEFQQVQNLATLFWLEMH